MRRFAWAAPVLLLAATAASAAPDHEAELAKAVEGRVAGAPVDCLNLRDIQSTRIIDGTAIVYETLNRTLYINRPASGAAFLRWGLALVTDTHTSQLCSIDTVRLLDTGSRSEAGSVGLGKFVPYKKMPK